MIFDTMQFIVPSLSLIIYYTQPEIYSVQKKQQDLCARNLQQQHDYNYNSAMRHC